MLRLPSFPALLAAFAALAAFVACFAARAAEASLQVLVERPFAVRGAPVLVPVRLEGAAPSAVALRAIAADGSAREIEGQVLWPRRPGAGEFEPRRWARASNDLRLSRERPEGATDAYLALDPPAGTPRVERFELGRTRIAPRWVEPADAHDALLTRLARRASRVVPAGAPDPLLSLPDPAAPFERFRWEIGCALRGWDRPPAFETGSPDDLGARATTALWLAALDRLAASSEGVAVECAERLVATCRDDTAPAPIAAWIADPSLVSSMLALALDQSRSGEALADAMLSWLRVRSSISLWIEDETRDEVVLALANPTTSEEVVRLSWVEGLWLDVDDPPLAALVPAGEVARARIPRPRRVSADGTRAAHDDAGATLRVEHGGEVRTLAVTPPVVRAGVAGVVVGRFLAPLDLVAISAGDGDAGAVLSAGAVSLRPRLDAWEVFAEVRTGAAPTAADAVLFAGAAGSSLTVRGDGSVEDAHGLLADAALEFRAYGDRFRVAFALPPAWIERVDGEAVVALGLRRSGAGGWVDAPFATVPWRARPRTIGIDLLGGGARLRETLYSAP